MSPNKPQPAVRPCCGSAPVPSGSHSSAIPNVGKSVVFGRLTGRYATVSNYPGTTVAVTKGRALVGAEVCDIVDTPGVNAIEGCLTEDEQITRAVLVGDETDLMVQVVDARNIRRALMLTAQLAALRQAGGGCPEHGRRGAGAWHRGRCQ